MSEQVDIDKEYGGLIGLQRLAKSFLNGVISTSENEELVRIANGIMKRKITPYTLCLMTFYFHVEMSDLLQIERDKDDKSMENCLDVHGKILSILDQMKKRYEEQFEYEDNQDDF